MAKNLLVGDAITYERKIREVIVASRIENARSPSRKSWKSISTRSTSAARRWGVELAARGYFGKPVKDLTLTEGAFLAGLTKGPAYFNPDRHRERAQERLEYVLGRMKDDGAISDDADEAGAGRRGCRSSRFRGRGGPPDSIWSTRSAARPARSPGSAA